jgi:uncharacterized protein (TIRG00374 family)
MTVGKRSWVRGAARWLPGVVISVVALAVLLNLASWQDIMLAFESVRPLNLLVATLLTLVSLGTRAMAWQVLLERKASFQQSFFTINIGYLLNNVFPLRAGEFGRALIMGRSAGISPLHVLSTIVIERAFDLVMAAILLLGTLPLALSMDWARPVALVTLAVVLIGLIVLFIVARNQERVMNWINRLALRWPIVQKHVVPRIGSMLSGFSVLSRPSQFFLSFFWIAASWAIWVLIYYVMLITIAPDAPLWWAAFIDSVLAMGVALPSAPGALGIYEASIVGALSILGVTTGALGYAFLMHIFNYAITGVLGLWALMREGRSLGSLFAEVQSSQEIEQQTEPVE